MQQDHSFGRGVEKGAEYWRVNISLNVETGKMSTQTPGTTSLAIASELARRGEAFVARRTSHPIGNGTVQSLSIPLRVLVGARRTPMPRPPISRQGHAR